MREQLKALYTRNESRIADVLSRCPLEMNGPFYISPADKYVSANQRIAFVGQETRGWPCKDITAQLEHYQRFNLGEKYHASPFWNIIRKLEKGLSGTTLNSVWLNLNRFDERKQRPSNDALKQLARLDDILLDELRIVAPNVTIWFTGPSYDSRLECAFEVNRETIDGFGLRMIARLNSSLLPGINLRTYHPRYLRQSKNEEQVLAAIENVATRQDPG